VVTPEGIAAVEAIVRENRRVTVNESSKYSPQHHVLKHPQLPFLPKSSDQVLHPYRTGTIIVIYILIFKFLDSNLEDKTFCTE